MEECAPLGPVEEYGPDEDRILAESARSGSEEANRRTLTVEVSITVIRGNDAALQAESESLRNHLTARKKKWI